MKADRFYLNIKTKTSWIQPLPLLHITQFLGFLFWPDFPKRKGISCPGLTPAFPSQPHPTLTQPHPSMANQGHHDTTSQGPFLLLRLSSSRLAPSCRCHMRHSSLPEALALSASMRLPTPSWPLRSASS